MKFIERSNESSFFTSSKRFSGSYFTGGRFLDQNGGKFSKRRREKQFEEFRDEEKKVIEEAFHEMFNFHFLRKALYPPESRFLSPLFRPYWNSQIGCHILRGNLISCLDCNSSIRKTMLYGMQLLTRSLRC